MCFLLLGQSNSRFGLPTTWPGSVFEMGTMVELAKNWQCKSWWPTKRECSDQAISSAWDSLDRQQNAVDQWWRWSNSN
jgi:hypothetical protein